MIIERRLCYVASHHYNEEAAPAVWRLSAEDQSFDHPNNVYQLGDAGPDTTDTECHN